MTILETVIFYIIVAVFCVFISNLADKKNKRSLLYLIIIILATVAGFRHKTVGIDTELYMNGIEYFYRTGKIAWYCSFSLEYGYFTRLVYGIFHNYNFLLYIEAVIINWLIVFRFWDFRKKSSFPFMIFIYLIVIYLRTFNLNVQYIAVSMVFFATRFLEKKKNMLYITIVLIASLLHVSALIGLVYYLIYWLNFKDLTKNKIIIKTITAMIGSILLVYAGVKLLERYSKYFSGRESSIGLMVFAQFFVYIFFYWIYRRIRHRETDISIKRLMNKINIYYLIGIFLSASSYIISNAGRISYYFMIFEPVFYGVIVKDKKVDKYYKILLCLWFILYAIYVIMNTNKVVGYIPYNFFWMKK